MAEDSVLAELTDKNVLTQVDLGEFMRFKQWMQSIKKEGNDLPKTIDGWKQDFTEDIWDAFCDTKMKSPPNPKPTPTPAQVLAPAPATAPNPTVQTTTTTTKSKNLVKVSLSDFPTFDGNQRNWKPFKREVTSTMGLLQLTSLLSVTKLTDVPSHTAKTISDPLYKTRNQEFYSILSKKLAKGTAASKVDVHLATMDGALVWKDICDYYDFGGDKESRITSLIGDLTKHYLYPESSGGYDTYYNRFDEKCQELDLAGIQVPSAIKKTLFLEGIKDRAYEAVKDTCASVDYESAVDKLRTKAIALGKANSRSYPRRSNKKARKGDYDDDYDDDHGSEQEDYDEQESYSDEHEDYDPRRPSSFSSDVWESMTQANRKWILQHKKKRRKAPARNKAMVSPMRFGHRCPQQTVNGLWSAKTRRKLLTMASNTLRTTRASRKVEATATLLGKVTLKRTNPNLSSVDQPSVSKGRKLPHL
ncbi:expressed unknown protein [Seminavis robusta]|uniref:Uncharacterized protein n=1 Tax=Seminavis robusta TaxID=568900 RepID=A0A9N8DDY2_9STRA|nr:expressed unknown protein [Seminavis robusta]|eukprot:Sro50_g028930.1 n/a (474) ;mRNA; f:23288-24709